MKKTERREKSAVRSFSFAVERIRSESFRTIIGVAQSFGNAFDRTDGVQGATHRIGTVRRRRRRRRRRSGAKFSAKHRTGKSFVVRRERNAKLSAAEFIVVGRFDDQFEFGGENRRGNEPKRKRRNVGERAAVRLAALSSALLPVDRSRQKQFVLHRFVVLRKIVEQFENDSGDQSRFSPSNVDDGRMNSSSRCVAFSFVVSSLFGVFPGTHTLALLRRRRFI